MWQRAIRFVRGSFRRQMSLSLIRCRRKGGKPPGIIKKDWWRPPLLIRMTGNRPAGQGSRVGTIPKECRREQPAPIPAFVGVLSPLLGNRRLRGHAGFGRAELYVGNVATLGSTRPPRGSPGGSLRTRLPWQLQLESRSGSACKTSTARSAPWPKTAFAASGRVSAISWSVRSWTCSSAWPRRASPK